MNVGGARARYLFDLEACLEWWIPAPTSMTPDRSAIDAALKVLASPRNVSANELKPWFATGFEQEANILTDGWSGYNFLESAGFEYEAHPSPGGWRSAKSPTGS